MIIAIDAGNHIMFGGFDPFLHTHLGGLDSVVSGSSGGWERILVRVAPTAIAAVGGASNQYETRFGTVSLSWRYDDDDHRLTMALQVPVGSTAEVHSPLAVGGRSLLRVKEGDSQLWTEPGSASSSQATPALGAAASSDAQRVEAKVSAVVVTVGSGVWDFAAEYL
jgi:hypothetical protein